jgi:hypothetical protein
VAACWRVVHSTSSPPGCAARLQHHADRCPKLGSAPGA